MMMTPLHSKWAACEARGESISESIRDDPAVAGKQPAHFHRNPSGCGQLAVVPPPRRIGPYDFGNGRFARALKNRQLTDGGATLI
jgi:hypothetical protein